MREIDIERMRKHGLSEADFLPKSESVTVEDLLEAVTLLAEMVFEKENEE